MTVIINEEALRRFLAVPPRPVAEEMLQQGARLAADAQTNVDKILWRAPTRPRVIAEMTHDDQGPLVRVHLDEGGRLSGYLDEKEAREHSWLLPALEGAQR